MQLLPVALLASAALASSCSSDTFEFPSILGAELLSVTAEPVVNYTGNLALPPEGAAVPPEGITACSLNITYTHPGHDDTVNVRVLLPEDNAWNDRLVTIGGGGFATGNPDGDYMIYYTSESYATVTTDGGHTNDGLVTDWVLKSPGNMDYPLVVNWAHRASVESARIGKAAAKGHYGRSIKYSYWHGCSNGGRQALAMAERYPDEFDGIIAAAPGVRADQAFLGLNWPQVAMKEIGAYPSPCELNAIRDAAVKACDGLDGIEDGVLALPDACKFKAAEVVGQKATCPDNTTVTISKEAAEVIEAIWEGVVDESGRKVYPGTLKGEPVGEIAERFCNGTGEECAGSPTLLPANFIRSFIMKDDSFDVTSLTLTEYIKLFDTTSKDLQGLIGSSADLYQFREAGGKLLWWHGLDDQVLTVENSRLHYADIKAADAKRDATTSDYLRYFEVPGATHCTAPQGLPFPLSAMKMLRKWVEEGVAPERLETVGAFEGSETMAVCQYPNATIWKGDELGFVCEKQ